MEYRRLGTTGIRVHRAVPRHDDVRQRGRRGRRASAIVDRFLDAGGNFVDTANVYSGGASEEITGRGARLRRARRGRARDQGALPDGRRTNDVGLSRRSIRTQVEASLRRLGTEWIDLYQVHCWDPRTPLEETLSTLDDLVHEGKVRYIGASNFAGWHLAKALGLAALHDWEPFVSLQPRVLAASPATSSVSCSRCAGARASRSCRGARWPAAILTGKYRGRTQTSRPARGAPTPRTRSRSPTGSTTGPGTSSTRSARSPPRSGRRRRRSRSTGCSNRPGVTAPIIGARNLTQLDDNLGATGWTLGPRPRACPRRRQRLRHRLPVQLRRDDLPPLTARAPVREATRRSGRPMRSDAVHRFRPGRAGCRRARCPGDGCRWGRARSSR